jgi:hypothetical protein
VQTPIARLVQLREPKHLVGGASIERGRSVREVRRYASKSYMGKEFIMPEVWEYVGKFWGVIGRKNLLLSQCETMVEDRRVMILVRPTLRRFLRSKGLRRGAKTSVRLYTEEHLQWARVVDLAKTGDCQPIDFAAPPIG